MTRGTCALLAVGLGWALVGCGGSTTSDVVSNDLADAAALPDVLDVDPTGEVGCPQPVVVIEEGEQAFLGDTIHLHGEQSQAASGSILSYSWSVSQPPENKAGLLPDAHSATPTHQDNVGGQYTYCLDVCDAQRCSNDPVCGTTACRKINACCLWMIHAELTWDTPGDANPFDEGPDAGSDMDLHVLHPFATGAGPVAGGAPDGWFNVPYDLFWYNRNPEWESADPNVPDNPTLDRDDSDGAGPENANLFRVVYGRTYRVGVHYWDDHGFGASFARLKIYIGGQLTFDRDLSALGVPMNPCDLWEAATIQWPQGIVAAVQNTDGTLKITPTYTNPSFPCGAPKSVPPR